MRCVHLTMVDPNSRTDGGRQRVHAFVDALSELGHEVRCVYPVSPGATITPPDDRFVPVPAMTLGRAAWPSAVRSLKRRLFPIPLRASFWSPALQEQLVALQPDVFLVSQLHSARYFPVLAGAKLWLDFVDVNSEIIAKRELAEPGHVRLSHNWQRRQLQRAEARACTVASTITTAGWADGRSLRSRTRASVRWLPNPVVAERFLPPRPSGGARRAGFLGSMTWWPNVDAYEHLRATWAPLLHQQGWEVIVAGYGSEGLTASPHIRNIGTVKDIAEFYEQVDCTLAPVRFGGGMKVKVIESLFYGRPVVASRIALEGLPPLVAELVSVADLERPNFGFLGELPPLPAEQVLRARLTPFTASGFLQSVRACVEELSEGV